MEGLRQRKREKDDSEPVEEKKGDHDNDQFCLPSYTGYVTIFGFLLLIKIIASTNQRLPTGLTIADEEAHPDRFIAERAENDLLKLVSLGPKVTGSYECEILAPRLLRQEIADIARTVNSVHSLQQALQKPKGSFYLALKPFGFQSIYENIQNIAVRLGPQPPSNHSVLVNCHYDTVPESPGASDNGLNCAVMIEVLRKLSRSSEPLKHNIIFLFNGAEENLLQAAHGFITKHHWSKEIRLVINLDSAGAGGREILFQASPDHQWLLKTYARVIPRPYANTGAQEIFESGLIPSDTDFRIFRDFGKIPGLDMAHTANGYVYHTRFDSMDFISSGVFQHTGDNVLALLRALAKAPELEDIEAARQPEARLVYYDIFGTCMFVYSHRTGIILNLIAALLSLYTASKLLRESGKPTADLITVTTKSFISGALGILVNTLIAMVLDKMEIVMSWYARPYLALVLYVCPCTAIALLQWSQKKGGGAQTALEYFCGGQISSSIILIILTLLGIRTSYVIMLLVIFPAIAGIICSNLNYSVFGKLLIVTGSSLAGVSIAISFALGLMTVLIPISGRAGSFLNPELIIGNLLGFFCFIIGNSFVSLLLTVKSPKTVARHLLFLHLTIIFLLTTASFGFPYSESQTPPALQRFYVYHTEQTLYNSNGSVINTTSGAYILPIDRNRMKYVQREVPELRKAVAAHCADGLLCQFPLYNSRLLNQAKLSFWLPLQPPQIFYRTKLELLESSLINPQHRRLKFSLKGPDHVSIIISPRKGVQLSNWTLGLGVEPAHYEGRTYYVVYYSDGQVGDVNTFSLDLIAEENRVGPWVDISAIGHYQHQKGMYTSEFNDLLGKFPAWAHVTSWVATVHGYVF